jgi:hypothetical protein
MQAPHYRVSRCDALGLLHQAISQNLVHVNGRLFRQSQGIPQVGKHNQT